MTKKNKLLPLLLILALVLSGCGLSFTTGRRYHADYYKEVCLPCVSYHWREKTYTVGMAFYQVADIPWTYIEKKKAGMCIGDEELQFCFGFFHDKEKPRKCDHKRGVKP